jgi:hypothetical protein
VSLGGRGCGTARITTGSRHGTPHPGLPPEGGAPGQDGSTTASSRPQPLPLRELQYRGARGPAPIQRSLGKADQVAGAKPRGQLDASSQSGELPGAAVAFRLHAVPTRTVRGHRADIACHYGVPTGTPHPGLPPEGGAQGQDGSITASSRPHSPSHYGSCDRGAGGPAPVQRSRGKADQVAGAKPRGRLDASSQSGELPGAAVAFRLRGVPQGVIPPRGEALMGARCTPPCPRPPPPAPGGVRGSGGGDGRAASGRPKRGRGTSHSREGEDSGPEGGSTDPDRRAAGTM